MVNPDTDLMQVIGPGAHLPDQGYSPGSPPWQATPPDDRTPAALTSRRGPDGFGEFRAKPEE